MRVLLVSNDSPVSALAMQATAEKLQDVETEVVSMSVLPSLEGSASLVVFEGCPPQSGLDTLVRKVGDLKVSTVLSFGSCVLSRDAFQGTLASTFYDGHASTEMLGSPIFRPESDPFQIRVFGLDGLLPPYGSPEKVSEANFRGAIWPKSLWHNVGRKLSVDQAAPYLYDLQSKGRSVAVPGFPFVLHQELSDLLSPVLLAEDPFDAQSYLILDRKDIFALMGYPHDAFFRSPIRTLSELSELTPVSVAVRLVRWVMHKMSLPKSSSRS